MNIAVTQYTLSHYMFEIYVSGCIEHPCIGCYSPELWNPFVGDELNEERYELLKNNILSKMDMIENIMVCGGEVLEKPVEEVVELLQFLQQFKTPIWLFTRFEIGKVPSEVLKLVNYVKTGMYLQNKATDDNVQHGYKLASSNQKILSAEFGFKK